MPYAQAGNPTLELPKPAPSAAPQSVANSNKQYWNPTLGGTAPKPATSNSGLAPMAPAQQPKPPQVNPTPPAQPTNGASPWDQQAQTDLNNQTGVVNQELQKTADRAKSFGLDAGPTTIQGIVDQQKADQKEAKSALQKQIDVQNAVDQAEAAKFNTNAAGSIAATKTAYAQSREGAMSGTAPALQLEFVSEMNRNISENKTRLDAAQAQRVDMMRQLDEAQRNGNQELARSISGQLAGAQVTIDNAKAKYLDALSVSQQQAQSSMKQLVDGGGLTGLTNSEIAQVAQNHGFDPLILKGMAKAANTAFSKDQIAVQSATQDMFLKAIGQGIEITPDFVETTAQNLRIPPDKLQAQVAKYNASAVQINKLKGIDEQTKQTMLEEERQKLSDSISGLTTTSGQNLKALQNLYKTGASADIISAFKSAAGITDENDPMRQADLRLKNAQATIEEKKARGEPITTEDRLNEAKALEELSYLDGGKIGGADTAYIPKSPQEGIKVSTENGKYMVTAPPGKEFQCGAFVNRTWGARIFDSLGTQKMAVVDKMGFKTKGASAEDLASKVKPGMAFVMPIANNIYDHVGLVETVTPGGITTIEANANGKAKTNSVGPGKSNVTSGRFIPWNQLYGFVPPPSSNVQEVGKKANNYNNFLQEARDKGLPFGEAKKYAAEKTTAALNSDGSENENLDDLAKSIANYDIDPKDLSSRLPKGATSSERAKVLQMAKEINPEFSEGNFAAKKAYIDSWSGNPSPGTPAFMNDTANTAIKHLKAAYDAFSEIKNSGAKDANAVSNYLKDHAGDPAISAFMAIQEPLAGELGKASTGGVPNESEMANYRKILDVNKSPDQMMATLKAQMELLGGRVKTNVSRYKKTIGSLPKDPVLDDESVAALKSIGLNPSDYDPSLTQNTESNKIASPLDHSSVKNKIQQSLDAKLSPNYIMANLLSTSPQYKQFIIQATQQGKTPTEIVQYLAQQ